MVKLAEPRTKKRYNLVPRGQALYEDESRFGTKMLEKMGWSKGKGLGAREEGSKDFVRVRYKHDAEGLGYEARDDQWTQHQESFNGLLKSLSGNTDDNKVEELVDSDVEHRGGFGLGFSQSVDSNKTSSLKAETSGQSLEERSKQSRARVHYKKFTRGKDLARYSEKDLANIFGKKATDDADQPATPQITEIMEECAKSEHFKSSTLSVSDYFKNKMEALKLKQNGGQRTNGYSKDVNAEVDQVEVVKKKKKNKKDKHVKNEDTKLEEYNKLLENEEEHDKGYSTELAQQTTEEDESIKKKKKNKKEKPLKNKETNLEVDKELMENKVQHEATQDSVEMVKKKKKNKKDKHMKIEKDEVKVEEVNNKISKKSKRKGCSDLVQVEETKLKRKNEEILKNDAKKFKENSTKECSGSKETSDGMATDNQLTLEDMLEVLRNEQTFQISQSSAESFRFADLSGFKGANFSDLRGYDMPVNVKLQIIKSATDSTRLVRLWTQNQEQQRTATPYEEYTLLARTARENNEKQPRLKTYKFAKKNAFKLVNI